MSTGKYRETCGHGFPYHYGFHLVRGVSYMSPGWAEVMANRNHGPLEFYRKEACDQPPLTWWEENMDRLTMEKKYGDRRSNARHSRGAPSPMSPGEQFFFAVVILFLVVCCLVSAVMWGIGILLQSLWEAAMEHPVIASAVSIVAVLATIGVLTERAKRKRVDAP